VIIIILNWNGKDDTTECLESLKEIRYENYEIIVVDNCSTDGSASLFEKEFPHVILIKNKKNLGFAGGMNVGIDYALKHKNPDYVLCLNNDTLVDNFFLTEMVKVAESDPKIGEVGPKIYDYYNRNVLESAGCDANLVLRRYRNIGYKKKDRGQYDQTRVTNALGGVCILFKRGVLERVKGFEPIYFANCEDLDICLRVKKEGYKLVYVHTSMVWHKGGASKGGKGSVRYDANQAYLDARNWPILVKRNANFIGFFLFLFFFISIWTPIFFVKCFSRGKLISIKNHIRGITDFMYHRGQTYVLQLQ